MLLLSQNSVCTTLEIVLFYATLSLLSNYSLNLNEYVHIDFLHCIDNCLVGCLTQFETTSNSELYNYATNVKCTHHRRLLCVLNFFLYFLCVRAKIRVYRWQLKIVYSSFIYFIVYCCRLSNKPEGKKCFTHYYKYSSSSKTCTKLLKCVFAVSRYEKSK